MPRLGKAAGFLNQAQTDSEILAAVQTTVGLEKLIRHSSSALSEIPLAFQRERDTAVLTGEEKEEKTQRHCVKFALQEAWNRRRVFACR